MRLQKAVQTLVVFFASISVCVLLASASSQARYFPDKYDREIRSATKGYWGYFPYWKAWKAQLYQESLLDPLAVSPVGAAGLAQFMPATWAEVSKKLGIEGVNPRDAKHAIHAGAYYMSTLNRGWSSPRPALETYSKLNGPAATRAYIQTLLNASLRSQVDTLRKRSLT